MKTEKIAWMAVGFLTSKYMYIPMKRIVVLAIMMAMFGLGYLAGQYDINIIINQLK